MSGLLIETIFFPTDSLHARCLEEMRAREDYISYEQNFAGFCQQYTEHFFQPMRATEESAGWDIYAQDSFIIPPTDSVLVKTGLRCILPLNHVMLVRSKSGLRLKAKLHSFDGTIDSDYRDEIGIILTNDANTSIQVHRGNKFTQVIVVPVLLRGRTIFPNDAKMHPRYNINREGGFGSSGN